jgi:hypothetical protein
VGGDHLTFRPDEILKVLERYGVQFVVIGGLAAALHGAGTVTFDVDVVPDPSADNLERLSAALDELNARVRVDGIEGGLAFDHDPQSLGMMTVLNLVTIHGDFDIAFHPSGIPSYSDWSEHATGVEALGVHFQLGSLADVIQSKEAADRPKDQAALPVLRELLRRQDGSRGKGR